MTHLGSTAKGRAQGENAVAISISGTGMSWEVNVKIINRYRPIHDRNTTVNRV